MSRNGRFPTLFGFFSRFPPPSPFTASPHLLPETQMPPMERREGEREGGRDAGCVRGKTGEEEKMPRLNNNKWGGSKAGGGASGQSRLGPFFPPSLSHPPLLFSAPFLFEGGRGRSMATDLLCRAKEEAFSPSTETACPLDVEGKRLALGLQGCLLRRCHGKGGGGWLLFPPTSEALEHQSSLSSSASLLYVVQTGEKPRVAPVSPLLDVVDLENRALSVKTELLAIPRQRAASSGPLNRENFSSSSQVPSFFWAREKEGGNRRIGKWRP